jgi:septal ring factor EnvC (AmiA/AmiB activator)
MSIVRSLILVGFASIALPAGAQVTEIYRCVEPSGRSLYTSDKRETAGRKCELVSRQVNVAPATKGKSAANFPKESQEQRAAARDRQRQVLQKELATEEQLLEKSRKDLADQEAIRTGDEKNYARVEQRLRPFKDSVETHQKNIEALKRELGNLSR